MGKSPGKWIKTVLFRKKSSQSFPLKARNDKEKVTAKTQETDLVSNPLVASEFYENAAVTNEKLERDTEVASDLPSERGLSLPDIVESVTGEPQEIDVMDHAETMRRKQAATMVQAALRGYLARRAFQDLKGIIMVQAFVRGHLVRRQAVSTLYGMVGIVKLQAVARGRKVRCSNIGLQVEKMLIAANHLERNCTDPFGVIALVKKSTLSSNVFVCKLLESSPKAMPLQHQYKSSEPNSVDAWFGRWSVTLSKPFLPTNEVIGSKSLKKQDNSQNNESQISKGKLSPVSSTLTQSTIEIEKPRRNFRKVLSHSVDSSQDNPQNVLEKVKRSLRKVHNPKTEVSIESKLDSEKPKHDQVEVLSSSCKGTEKKTMDSSEMINKKPDVSIQSKLVSEKPKYVQDQVKVLISSPKIIEKNTEDANEKMDQDTDVTISKLPKLEANLEPLVNVLEDDHPAIESLPFDDGEVFVSNREISSRPDSAVSENQKSARKVSSSTKHEQAENGMRSRSTVPSYMAATASAKAKLRAQGSPQFAEDITEKQNLSRRHSLPAFTNGKTSSPSPRALRAVQTGGKCVSRSDKSLSSSRDGNPKAVQVEWRR